MARDQAAYSRLRRSVCWTLAGVLVSPSIAIAQASKVVRRIGWLEGGAPESRDGEQKVDDALAEVGWIVGQNVLIDRRYVRYEALQRTAEEFVNAKVDLIIANGTPATRAAKNATSTIPILMWSAADPVASGLVASLAKPGGNVTGMAQLAPEQSVKRLSLLRELSPGIQRVGELDLSANPAFRVIRRQLEEAYRSVGMEPIFVDITSIAKFEDALAEVVRRHAQALNIDQDTLRVSWIPQIFGAAVRVSLPTIVNSPQLLEAGALLSYAEDAGDFRRKNAVLFDKLLKGTKPADLPVEQPTKFNLGVNLKTSKALGLTIPQSLLLRADEVIH
jgi:ABC-type uncharacterized transport system substrate-binding protein